MIKRFLSVFCLLCSVSYAGAEVKYMTLEQTNNEKFSFLLSENPQITYEDGDLVINGSSSTSYAIGSVKDFHFTESDETAVDNLSADILRIISLDDATVEIQNAPANVKVSILSINGSVLATSKTDANGFAIVNLPNQKGVYVLIVGDRSLKIIRK